MAKIKLSPLALMDLKETRQYISTELENPIAAVNILSRITKTIAYLANTTYTGAKLSSIIDVETGHRFLVCGNYTAFYRVKEQAVYINRILYGRRDFVKLLLGECLEQEKLDE